VEEALSKERSLYIPMDMNTRFIGIGQDLQVSLDSGNPL